MRTLRKPRRPALNSKSCRGCKRWFVPKRKDQEYCDKNCRKEDYKTRFFGMTVTEKTCKHCGSAFTTSCSVKQDYCNVYCREAAAEIRAEERQQLAKLKDLALLHYLKNEREESNTNI